MAIAASFSCGRVSSPLPPCCWSPSPTAPTKLYLRFTHIYEYDARATADIVTISSRAEGWVVEMPALEGTRVEAGDRW